MIQTSGVHEKTKIRIDRDEDKLLGFRPLQDRLVAGIEAVHFQGVVPFFAQPRGEPAQPAQRSIRNPHVARRTASGES